eukprot:Hpha_TRINITY_DN15810_c0_g3::TRINITY_DN15810_c0_g3_i1::g.191287::m.191287
MGVAPVEVAVRCVQRGLCAQMSASETAAPPRAVGAWSPCDSARAAAEAVRHLGGGRGDEGELLRVVASGEVFSPKLSPHDLAPPDCPPFSDHLLAQLVAELGEVSAARAYKHSLETEPDASVERGEAAARRARRAVCSASFIRLLAWQRCQQILRPPP